MVISRTGKYTPSHTVLSQRASIKPEISPLMANSVSQFRKDMLEQEVERGFFKGDSTTSKEPGPTSLGYVTGLKKIASSGTGGGNGWTGSGGTMRQSPDIYSPIWFKLLLSHIGL